MKRILFFLFVFLFGVFIASHYNRGNKGRHFLAVASWYGPGYHGRTTANGEKYNMYGISAAHKTLPFGTKLLVTNPQNGRQVKLKINDRGPYIEGRSLDLSYGAAERLGMVRQGVVSLLVKIIS